MNTIVAIIAERFGFTQEHAISACERLSADPEILTAFLKWLENSLEIPKIECEGWTYSSLIDYGMQPIGAFLTLAWLRREPEEAKAALAEGYDSI